MAVLFSEFCYCKCPKISYYIFLEFHLKFVGKGRLGEVEIVGQGRPGEVEIVYQGRPGEVEIVCQGNPDEVEIEGKGRPNRTEGSFVPGDPGEIVAG